MKYLRPFNESKLSISDIETINDITLELIDLGFNIRIEYLSKIVTGWIECDKYDPSVAHICVIIAKHELDNDEHQVTPFDITDELIEVIDRLESYTKSIGWKPLVTFNSYNHDFKMYEDEFKPSYLKVLSRMGHVKGGVSLTELEFNLTKIE